MNEKLNKIVDKVIDRQEQRKPLTIWRIGLGVCLGIVLFQIVKFVLAGGLTIIAVAVKNIL